VCVCENSFMYICHHCNNLIFGAQKLANYVA